MHGLGSCPAVAGGDGGCVVELHPHFNSHATFDYCRKVLLSCGFDTNVSLRSGDC